MRMELKVLKGSVEKVVESFEMRMQEKDVRMEKRMEAMMGQVMVMMKTLMGEGTVGVVSQASGKGLIVEEKAKVSDSDSEIEDKEIRHSNDEPQGERKDERKGKIDVKKEKSKCQDESKDDHEWVKEVTVEDKCVNTDEA
ncbi:WD repeat-containing protein 43-like [Palaemon carinicauda]|uniref:WD repeat-containing protein 43-like n=1 Tax=Palaemon carinicauda TaxID=392227 RepID=UPI0035B68FAE